MIGIMFGIYVLSVVVCILTIYGYRHIILINNLVLGKYNDMLEGTTRSNKINILKKELVKINIIMTVMCIVPLFNMIIGFLLIISHLFYFLLLNSTIGEQKRNILIKIIENEIYKK